MAAVTALDTSVIIAGLLSWHEAHAQAYPALEAALSEEVPAVLPSKHFGANVAWCSAMILALNLNILIETAGAGADWVPKRMKAIRYWIINLPGRLVHHARQLTLRLSAGHPSNRLLLDARRAIAALAPGPSG